MNKGALRPTFSAPTLDNIHELLGVEVTEEERALQEQAEKEVGLSAAVVEEPGWEFRKKELEKRIQGYERGEAIGDLKGMSMSEIGQRYLVQRLVAAELQNVIDEIELAYAQTRPGVSDGSEQ